ncbi:MAG: transglutaminase domain-containing protein [Planctomycetes bacterium]|nr:transglutaminase domain-containing protein [Planctomycetota bacterium]
MRSCRRTGRVRPAARRGSGLAAAIALAATASAAPEPRVVRTDPHIRLVRYEHVISSTGARPARDVEVRIALPRDEERQELLAFDIAPPPEELRADAFGQLYAVWKIETLPPGARRSFGFLALARLWHTAWRLDPSEIGTRSEIPPDVRALYLSDAEFYRLDDPLVAEVGRVADGAPTILEEVRRLHDEIIARVEYVRDNRWDTAPEVLERGTGSCSEFNYAMIAVCRARGIPARYAGGTITKPDVGPWYEDRVYHRWTEVYLPRVGWYPVDLSRDNTAEKAGDIYRYFGKVGWTSLVMVHGGGGPLAATLWDYRSETLWRKEEGASIASRRTGTWTEPPDPAVYVRWKSGEPNVALAPAPAWVPPLLDTLRFRIDPHRAGPGIESLLEELTVER